jgi:hypothetical protein
LLKKKKKNLMISPSLLPTWRGATTGNRRHARPSARLLSVVICRPVHTFWTKGNKYRFIINA